MRARCDPAGARERVSAPDLLREDFERAARRRSGGGADAVGQRGRLPRRRDAVGAGARARGRRRADGRRRRETQYRIGSITKTFTAVGILQLRDAGELSLDDPLDRASAGERARADDRPHARALLRAPARAAGRDLGDDEGAVARGAAQPAPPRRSRCWIPARGGTTRTSPSPCSARSSRAHTAARWEEALQERILGPLGLSRTTPDESEPGRPRLLRRALLGRRPARARARSRRRRCARQALVDDRRPGPLGRLPRLRRRPRARRPRRSRRCRTSARWSTTPAGRWHGGQGSSSTAAARACSSATAARCRATWRGSSSTARRRSVRPCSRTRGRAPAPEKLALDLATAAIAALPAAADPWQAGEPAPAGDRAAARAAGGRRATKSCSRGGRAGSRRSSSAACPVATRRIFEPEGEDRFRSVEGRERGELLRVVRDAQGDVEKLYFATYPLRREPSTF